MALNPLGAGASAHVFGSGSAPKVGETFQEVMKGAHGAGGSSPHGVAPKTEAKAVHSAQPGQLEVTGAAKVDASTQVSASRMLDQLNRAQNRMEQILQLAESGRSFSPAQLLSLQTHVYRASQELDLAGKVVEKATGGVKQVLQTQV